MEKRPFPLKAYIACTILPCANARACDLHEIDSAATEAPSGGEIIFIQKPDPDFLLVVY
jgi:hypothetical protein